MDGMAMAKVNGELRDLIRISKREKWKTAACGRALLRRAGESAGRLALHGTFLTGPLTKSKGY